MDGAASDRAGAAADHLLCVMTRVLERGLGARKAWGPGIFGLGPVGSTLAWLGFFTIVWALVEGIAFAMGVPPEPQLVSLLAWGGCYAAAATFLSVVATDGVFDTVRRDILPFASSDYCTSVAHDLERRFPPAFLTYVPLVVAAASVPCAYWAIQQDLCGTGDTCRIRIPLHAPELWLWAVTFFYYFVCAARVVIAARFYLSFACCIEKESASFYVMGASETPVIKGLARMSGLMIGFWAMIFLCVLSSMLLAVLPLGDFAFQRTSRLLFILIPITGFFSLGFGSLVYLISEAQIRTVLGRFTRDHAAVVQREANARFDPAAARTKADGDALQRLADLHDRILAGGRYGSPLRAGLSIALPLLLPIVSLVQTAFGWLLR